MGNWLLAEYSASTGNVDAVLAANAGVVSVKPWHDNYVLYWQPVLSQY